MAKKASGTKYVSKGIHSNVRSGTKVKASPLDVGLNKWKAFLAGKKVMLTIQNPALVEGSADFRKNTNKRFIRVNMADLYGDFRKYQGNKNVIQGVR